MTLVVDNAALVSVLNRIFVVAAAAVSVLNMVFVREFLCMSVSVAATTLVVVYKIAEVSILTTMEMTVVFRKD